MRDAQRAASRKAKSLQSKRLFCFSSKTSWLLAGMTLPYKRCDPISCLPNTPCAGCSHYKSAPRSLCGKAEPQASATQMAIFPADTRKSSLNEQRMRISPLGLNFQSRLTNEWRDGSLRQSEKSNIVTPDNATVSPLRSQR